MIDTYTDPFCDLIFVEISDFDVLIGDKPDETIPPAKPDPRSEALPRILEGDVFLRIKYPPYSELVEGLLLQGTKILIAAPSKAGKTWLLLLLAVSVANGTPFLGCRTKKARVLYLNLEILDKAFQKRCAMVCKAMGIDAINGLHVWNLRGYEADIAKLADKIIAEIKDHGGFDLIIIDPVYKCYAWRDENSASDMANFLSNLERIASATGAAVVYSTHFSKGNQATKNTLDRVSGSGVFARDADTFISLTEHALEDHYTVELVVRNGPTMPSFVVKREVPLFHVVDDADPAQLKRSNRRTRTAGSAAPAQPGRPRTCSADDISGVLPSSGLRSSDWATVVCEKFNCSEGTFKARLRELKAGNRVTQQGGKYFPAPPSN